ncbi:hypothetical protein CPB84DRAFT_1826667 [Gymnopilus junonius]|uniref:Uncharacterized protein n=1 Tax=Gymnopilus junonius TaxID=109634 RepID=A0A9P5TJQ5_GYMJU|nr:hypothetical protein CPB84DRAFT_1826667 [Gymnopilus junonius]
MDFERSWFHYGYRYGRTSSSLMQHQSMITTVIRNIYSVAGAIFLFKQGAFFFFVYPEWLIYGGIALAIGTAAILSIIALATRSRVLAGTVKYLWPFLIVFSILRGIIMTLELLRGKDNINWECSNGGQLWQSDSSSSNPGTLPGVFCTVGFNSLWAGFIIALTVDLLFQVSLGSQAICRLTKMFPSKINKFYIAILIRRFSDRVDHLRPNPIFGRWYNNRFRGFFFFPTVLLYFRRFYVHDVHDALFELIRRPTFSFLATFSML